MTVGTDEKTIVADGGTITLGEEYCDTLTGFKGTATRYDIALDEPNQVYLENEMGMRWLPVGRVQSMPTTVH